MNVTDIQDMIGLLSREQGPAVFCWVQKFITALVQKKKKKEKKKEDFLLLLLLTA